MSSTRTAHSRIRAAIQACRANAPSRRHRARPAAYTAASAELTVTISQHSAMFRLASRTSAAPTTMKNTRCWICLRAYQLPCADGGEWVGPRSDTQPLG